MKAGLNIGEKADTEIVTTRRRRFYSLSLMFRISAAMHFLGLNTFVSSLEQPTNSSYLPFTTSVVFRYKSENALLRAYPFDDYESKFDDTAKRSFDDTANMTKPIIIKEVV